jgi:hypothetical protein
MGHTSNPNYSRNWRLGSLGNKFMTPQPNHQLGVVVWACHPSYLGSINRKISIQAGLGVNARPCPKNN